MRRRASHLTTQKAKPRNEPLRRRGDLAPITALAVRQCRAALPLLLRCLELAAGKGYGWDTIEAAVTSLGISRSTAKRYRAALRAAGVIVWIPLGRRQPAHFLIARAPEEALWFAATMRTRQLSLFEGLGGGPAPRSIDYLRRELSKRQHRYRRIRRREILRRARAIQSG